MNLYQILGRKMGKIHIPQITSNLDFELNFKLNDAIDDRLDYLLRIILYNRLVQTLRNKDLNPRLIYDKTN